METILEEIRVELSVSNYINTFSTAFHLAVTGIEKGSGIIGIDLSGLSDDITSDKNFDQNIKMLACEVSLCLSPQKEIIMRLLRAIMLRYQLNKKNKVVPEIKISDVNNLKEKYSNLWFN